MTDNRQQFADLILKMNYGELKGISGEFSEMIDKEVRPEIKTTEDFAELLFDWADAQKE